MRRATSGRGVVQSIVLAAAVAQARSAGAEDELLRATTVREALGESIRHQRFRGWVFGVPTAASLVVTMVGVLALIAMSTAQRTRELGVRVALGATQPSLLWTCIRQALALVLSGLAVGGVVSAWAVTLLRGYLFQVTEYDPRVWALAVGVVVAATGLGALWPAMRVTRGNPVTALRAE
jgi:putative ABC transport system permease protein